MKIALPAEAEKIIRILEENGFETCVVGGCVRDSLLGLTPADWDICTAATPDEAAACLAGYRILETGLRFGAVTVVTEDGNFDVATYRFDGAYSDCRRPDQVKFVKSLREDLARRDFTVNAMAYRPDAGLIDYFGGREDLEAKRIRAVGEADLRFREDALRMMRALRFAARLNFSIDPATRDSLHKNKKQLLAIAPERVSAELGKLLTGAGATAALREFADVIAVVLPEIAPMCAFPQANPYHYLDVWEHTLHAVEAAPADLTLRLALLLHDIGKPGSHCVGKDGFDHFYGHPARGAEMTERILRRLRFPNDLTADVKELVYFHDSELAPDISKVKRRLNRLGETQFRRLLEVRRADALAQSARTRKKRMRQLAEIPFVLERIFLENQCFSLRDLAVSGRDLIAAGMPEGRGIGQTLDRLLDLVIEGELENEHAVLMDAAQRLDK
ncbi:MAG: HD domain-containing protein [Clostridiales Family XIII bacterium]|jgi:tRNA nucleotidyltransferase (CCA-adding enzyme)|nr:HD domain-containing protein [Clostridiales Family XIII bacterium]